MTTIVLQAAPPAQGGGYSLWVMIAIIITIIIFLIRRKKKLKSIQIEQKSKDSNVSKSYKCFIAGSTMLQTERDAIRAVIAEIHNRWSSKNIYITSYTFEDFDNNVHVGGLQNQYDQFISQYADCIIFIIDGEIGSKTLHEFEIALNAYKARRRPSIYVYNSAIGKKHPQSEAFTNKVVHEGHYWRPYSNIADLKLKFKEDITNELIGKYV